MTKGIIFDIKELAVFDGPGIRTTVFLKGCPLRCRWCHNPEGLSAAPQLMVSLGSCTHCGRCKEVCPSPEHCITCGRCVPVCPLHLRRIAGTPWTAQDLADRLLRDKEILGMSGGGVTFSGGEPTLQGTFLLEVLPLLCGMHRAIETCAHCDSALFAAILAELDYVIMDLKIADPAAHRQWTGVDNGLILKNLRILEDSGLPYRIRVPLIPGVTDTPENLNGIAALLEGSRHLEQVELLPYHRTAGAKYEMVSRVYDPRFDETVSPRGDLSPFAKRGIPASVL